MNEGVKALLVFGGGLLAYFIIKPIVFKENKKKEQAAADADKKKKNAGIALRAYKAALANDEPREALDELNTELVKEFGMRVLRRKKDKVLVVTDSEGEEVLEDK